MILQKLHQWYDTLTGKWPGCEYCSRPASHYVYPGGMYVCGRHVEVYWFKGEVTELTYPTDAYP